MINLKLLTTSLITSIYIALLMFNIDSLKKDEEQNITMCYVDNGCVFKTIFGKEAYYDDDFVINNSTINTSVVEGLEWLVQAQSKDGGWGAGSHARQDILDPHAVPSDPATTAMAAMALIRTGSRLDSGPYASNLKAALLYLLNTVESTPENQIKITDLTNTQIQSKLGQHIDLINTVQFLSNITEYVENDNVLKRRVKSALSLCIKKMEGIQNGDGSVKGAGWAGVLQSALANNALESAVYRGVDVDENILKNSRNYQKNNYNVASGDVNTERGAGIVLYSVTGSARASAKQARKVREQMIKAKSEGKIHDNALVTSKLLEEIGFAEEEANEYLQSYQVYESAKNVAQEDDVMTGFGNNGGEEFLSYLQTGESLIINKDQSWVDWYENISTRLVQIQNDNGSWSGHHCITSPVFCTATTLLTLSINNDMDQLTAMGKQ